jgi:hypothetical protein
MFKIYKSGTRDALCNSVLCCVPGSAVVKVRFVLGFLEYIIHFMKPGAYYVIVDETSKKAIKLWMTIMCRRNDFII